MNKQVIQLVSREDHLPAIEKILSIRNIEEGLFEFVCSWPIWRKVRIPFVGKLETYIERAVYLPGFAYAK